MGGASDENRQPLAKPVLEAAKTTASFARRRERNRIRGARHMERHYDGFRAPEQSSLRRAASRAFPRWPSPEIHRIHPGNYTVVGLGAELRR